MNQEGALRATDLQPGKPYTRSPPGESAMRSHNQLDRRTFFKLTGVAAATAVLGTAPVGNVAYGAALTKAQREKLTPDEIIAHMKQGNQRFRLGKESPHDYLAQQKASAKGQYPAAVILSCIDSRAPAETIMDLGIGDTFNARVAGNIANDDIIGSMEFACKVAGAKVVLVMGHTACGAIKGAIDNVQLGNLTALLSKIRPAVSATDYKGDRSAKNYDFVDAVARKNVELTMENIHRRSAVLEELESSGAIKIVGAMYNLESGVVDFFA
jgi:carbonic anhydrase